MSDWLEKAARLRREGTPFAMATVIAAVAPTSAKPGAKAIILASGELDGWIGGGCAREVVIEEALDCIRTGKVRRIRLSPDVEPVANESVKELAMRCESGGTLEVHIEPVLPRMKLLIFGDGPGAQALARLASIVDYDITVYGPDAHLAGLPEGIEVQRNFDAQALETQAPSAAVIATQGTGDELALQGALASGAGYLTMITSRTKAASLFAGLEKRGVSGAALARIKVPAGLDIKAVTPEEIAVSVLAEIIQETRTRGIDTSRIVERGTDPGAIKMPSPTPLPGDAPEKVKDLVCGMVIDPRTAAGTTEFEGTTYHFCSLGCLESFEAEPHKYIQVEEA